MSNQDLRGHSSKAILDLRKRLPKCWKWVDWVLSSHCDKINVKKEVVLALLNKALPSKIEGDGLAPQINNHVVIFRNPRAVAEESEINLSTR